MSKFRLSKRIDITIAPNLLRQVDAAAKYYDAARSVIIRLALHDWLERHAAAPTRSQAKTVETAPKINTERAFHEMIKPNMSGEELLAALQDYEAAQT